MKGGSYQETAVTIVRLIWLGCIALLRESFETVARGFQNFDRAYSSGVAGIPAGVIDLGTLIVKGIVRSGSVRVWAVILLIVMLLLFLLLR